MKTVAIQERMTKLLKKGKMTLQTKKKKWSMDFFIVSGVMTGILLPVRLLFVQYVSHDVWGSLGVISLISVVMVILVKKNKLGKFGIMFEKELTRLTSGKRRIFIMAWLTMLIIYFAISMIAIDQGNKLYSNEVNEAKQIIMEKYNLNFEKPETVIGTLEPNQIVSGLPQYANAMFTNFKAIAIVQAIMNDISNGFLLHFHTIFFVETVEVMGVFIFYSLALRRGK